MISTQRATGSLFGEIRSRTPSWSTSAAVPGRRVEAGVAQAREDLRGRQPGDVAHVRDLHRAVGVQVQLGAGLGAVVLGQAQPAQVVLERPVGVDARLDADLGRAVVDRLVHAARRSPRASCS